MAQLSSRKTLVRAGTVTGATIGSGFLFGEALGDYGGADFMPLLATGLVAGGATAFFETRDSS